VFDELGCDAVQFVMIFKKVYPCSDLAALVILWSPPHLGFRRRPIYNCLNYTRKGMQTASGFSILYIDSTAKRVQDPPQKVKDLI
jgi:hypothetical protein